MKQPRLESGKTECFGTCVGIVKVVFDDRGMELQGISIEGDGREVRSEGLALRELIEGLRLPQAESGFAAAVRGVLSTVSPGVTVTYGELAKWAGFPGAARAVGRVMARNPFALLVPCHRVIPADGGWGSYRWGSGIKAKLIQMERDRGLDSWEIL